MNKPKKFSNILSGNKLKESVDTDKLQSAVETLMNKLGYDSIEELKKEKSLISKLETLMKEFKLKDNISEDESEDIEDEIVKKGEPKKLEEDESEDIEDEISDMGEPEDLTDELEDELEETPTEKGKEVKRILSFDEFVSESYRVDEGNAFLAARAKAIQEERDEFEFNGKTYKVTTSTKSINEAEIKSDDEFKEYVTAVLKKAFGKDFDQAKADEVANGLIQKHKGDYGAMVGALQSSMG